MPETTSLFFDTTSTQSVLAPYLRPMQAATDTQLAESVTVPYSAALRVYDLPRGRLSVLDITCWVAMDADKAAIEQARQSVIQAALRWQKRHVSQEGAVEVHSYEVCHLDIQRYGAAQMAATEEVAARVQHDFGARYFMEALVIEMQADTPVLQVFGWEDWQQVLQTLQTPDDVWQFLQYHRDQLQQSIISGQSLFADEQALLEQFLHSEQLLTRALSIDNTLIKYGMREQPNSAAVRMGVALREKRGARYIMDMQQAAQLWAQLMTQILTLHAKAADPADTINTQAKLWQQELLDESLFSRHELVRTLYQYPAQPAKLRAAGYVVHQHSYTSVGRHYVLIFYGNAKDSPHRRAVIKPNLQQIAADVALRLPLAELHHVVVLGVEFVTEGAETFVDMDVWIQPVAAMTPRERQLTKQLQKMTQQHQQQPLASTAADTGDQHTATQTLPSIQLKLSVPAKRESLCVLSSCYL